MNKKRITALAACLLLAGCQVAPVNATTSITSTEGAGTKTISLLALVDGSAQITPDAESFPNNANYFYIEDADFSEVTFTPKADGAKAKLYWDGYLTKPNGKETVKEIWEEFTTVVESYIPEGFEFKATTIQSENWDDAYMETVPGAEVLEWKAYVYSVTYSWANVDEYVSKTKALIGTETYEQTELKELEDAGTPWATFTNNGDNSYTWREAYSINYWSVFGVADQVMNSEYFNRNGLNTSDAFSVALQEFKIGESDPTIVKVDNLNSLNEDLTPKFIEATGTITPAPAAKPDSNMTTVIAIVAGAAVVLAAGLFIILKKRK